MTRFFTKLYVFLIILICAIGIKIVPEFEGQDDQVAEYVDEYKGIAKGRGINFSRDPSIGFQHIPKATTLAVCSWQPDFNEITFDPDKWNRLTYLSRKILAFHELTHCYCMRDHDYDQGTKYEFGEGIAGQPGYFFDACPKSIMAPILMSDDCAISHYDHYLKEMLNRCDPYK